MARAEGLFIRSPRVGEPSIFLSQFNVCIYTHIRMHLFGYIYIYIDTVLKEAIIDS